MSNSHIAHNLTNERTIWNKFGITRKILRPDIQPDWNTLVLNENTTLQREPSLLYKNQGYLLTEGKKIFVRGPLSKTFISGCILAIIAGKLFIKTYCIK